MEEEERGEEVVVAVEPSAVGWSGVQNPSGRRRPKQWWYARKAAKAAKRIMMVEPTIRMRKELG